MAQATILHHGWGGVSLFGAPMLGYEDKRAQRSIFYSDHNIMNEYERVSLLFPTRHQARTFQSLLTALPSTTPYWSRRPVSAIQPFSAGAEGIVASFTCGDFE